VIPQTRAGRRQLILDILGVPVVTLGGRLDPQGAEQLRGGRARIARFAQAQYTLWNAV